MGFLPNSMLTMAHMPQLPMAFLMLTGVVFGGDLKGIMSAFADQVPNEASEEHFAALRKHFSERQIVQIVAVIAMFGFLNRWNDTMATTLEEDPVAFAERVLGSMDWTPGKHG